MPRIQCNHRRTVTVELSGLSKERRRSVLWLVGQRDTVSSTQTASPGCASQALHPADKSRETEGQVGVAGIRQLPEQCVIAACAAADGPCGGSSQHPAEPSAQTSLSSQGAEGTAGSGRAPRWCFEASWPSAGQIVSSSQQRWSTRERQPRVTRRSDGLAQRLGRCQNWGRKLSGTKSLAKDDRALGASDPSLDGACEQIAAACCAAFGSKQTGKAGVCDDMAARAVHSVTSRRLGVDQGQDPSAEKGLRAFQVDQVPLSAASPKAYMKTARRAFCCLSDFFAPYPRQPQTDHIVSSTAPFHVTGAPRNADQA
ncbi:hypothetical protein SVAN01_01906 [Stagonosporopsis vannaccii]|nr:hypothetical protein SVAN01_01906 [Stagonosporopsis vannaccii]